MCFGVFWCVRVCLEVLGCVVCMFFSLLIYIEKDIISSSLPSFLSLFVFVNIFLAIYLFLPSIHPFFTYLPTYLCILPSSLSLPIYLSMYPSFHPSILYLPTYLSTYLFFHHPTSLTMFYSVDSPVSNLDNIIQRHKGGLQ